MGERARQSSGIKVTALKGNKASASGASFQNLLGCEAQVPGVS